MPYSISITKNFDPAFPLRATWKTFDCSDADKSNWGTVESGQQIEKFDDPKDAASAAGDVLRMMNIVELDEDTSKNAVAVMINHGVSSNFVTVSNCPKRDNKFRPQVVHYAFGGPSINLSPPTVLP